MSTPQIHPITELATRAAALIPEPPVDAIHYLAWRELVWETAHRLADVAGRSAVPAGSSRLDPGTDDEGSAEHLLRLVAFFQGQREATSAVTCRAPGVARRRR